jgi:hypothetical protein
VSLPPLHSIIRCAKCRLDAQSARLAFCGPGRRQEDATTLDLACRVATEHLHRTCRDCEYTWLEACADAEAP